MAKAPTMRVRLTDETSLDLPENELIQVVTAGPSETQEEGFVRLNPKERKKTLYGKLARVRAASQALATDTIPLARWAVRSLTGLWRARSNPAEAADSLRAVSDEAVRTGEFLLSGEAVDRIVIGRALRGRGAPDGAGDAPWRRGR